MKEPCLCHMLRVHRLLRGMVTKAVQWAKDNNRCRVSPIHGEEEIYITIHDGFEMKVTESEELLKSGSMLVQDFARRVSFHMLG